MEVDNVVEKGTSLGVVKLINDQIRYKHSDFLTETQTLISPARAKDGNYYLTFRVAKKDADLTPIKESIPDDVPYEIIYGCKWEPRKYEKPAIKEIEVLDPGAMKLTMSLEEEIEENK